MRRRFGALVVGAALAGCGLTVEGVGVAPSLEAGAAEQPPTGPADGSVRSVADASLVGDGPADALPIDRPDARPAPPTSCYRSACTAGTCLFEQCETLGPHWPTLGLVGPGTMNNTGGYCNSRTTDADQRALREAVNAVPSGPFRYELQVILRTITAATKSTLAELVLGTRSLVTLVGDGANVRLCKSTPSGAVCAGAIPYMTETNTPVLVYGLIDRTTGYGTAIMQRRDGTSLGPGTGDCTEASSLELDGPFEGTTATARIGCVTGGTCTFDWWDGRFATGAP